MPFARQLRLCLVVAVAFTLTGCAELVTALETVAGTSQITIWTSDPSPSPIEVFVDGQSVGVLTQYRTSAPSCGAGSSGAVITVSRSPGTYSVSARETQAGGSWAPRSTTVASGECVLRELAG